MTVRIVQAGLGNRGGQWAEIVAHQGEGAIVAVVDTDPARIARFGERWPGIPAFGDLAAALRAVEADAVLLTTPPDGHLDQARLVFAAGLPLLCEKPLATDLAEAAEIVRLGEAARLPLTIGLNFRYLPVSQAIRDLVAKEAFGPPGHGQFIYLRNRDGYRPGLNRYPLTMRHPMMLEQSIHHLDLIRFAYGREVEAVSCRTWNPPWSQYAHDANVSCLLTLEGGLEVTYVGTWSGGWNGMRFEWRTDGPDGVIVQRELHSDLATARTGDPELTPYPLPEMRPFFDDTAALLGAFIAALRSGSPPPCTGRDHLMSLALCFAAIEASETGRRVDLAEFHARHGLEDLS